MAWLPLTSTTVEPARLDMERWAAGGIILSSVTTRYQLGFVFHAGSRIAPLRAATPHGTWESAMKAAFSASTSALSGSQPMNGEDIQLIAIPAAHTDGDTIVYFPGPDVIMTGDFYRSIQYPNIDRANGGSLHGMVNGLGQIIAGAGANSGVLSRPD